MPSFIRDLAALDRSSTPDVGGKAASLGELIGPASRSRRVSSSPPPRTPRT